MNIIHNGITNQQYHSKFDKHGYDGKYSLKKRSYIEELISSRN